MKILLISSKSYAEEIQGSSMKKKIIKIISTMHSDE